MEELERHLSGMRESCACWALCVRCTAVTNRLEHCWLKHTPMHRQLSFLFVQFLVLVGYSEVSAIECQRLLVPDLAIVPAAAHSTRPSREGLLGNLPPDSAHLESFRPISAVSCLKLRSLMVQCTSYPSQNPGIHKDTSLLYSM